MRVAYGVLLLLTLVAALPHARRYFQSERWGGYAQSSRWIDAVQNPWVGAPLLVLWMGAALCLIAGRLVVPAAALNLLLCHYLFIRMRWRGVLRGMGAPGFIAFWLGAAVFLLESTARHAHAAHGLVLLTLQVDFALIMISAGLFKLAAGYRHHRGMELGMVNPAWGYWHEFWRRQRPSAPVFRLLDEMAWFTEVAGGVLMLVPSTRWIGGAAILLSFLFIATQIRLGYLCEMVMVCALLFIPAWADARPSLIAGTQLPDSLQTTIAALCWTYLLLLPAVRAGMFYNQLRHRRLPGPLQTALDSYANAFGLILWRVFTADVVNFFIRVWEASGDAPRRLISEYRRTGVARFSQVAECIALTSVFTTLRYYPSNRALFEERLLRYARTIPTAPGSRLVFEWVTVATHDDRFAFVPVVEFEVDVRSGRVTDRMLTTGASVHDAPSASPLHEGARPGSYAPLDTRPAG